MWPTRPFQLGPLKRWARSSYTCGGLAPFDTHLSKQPIPLHGPHFYHLAPSVSDRPHCSSPHFRFPQNQRLKPTIDHTALGTHYVRVCVVWRRERKPPITAYAVPVAKKTVAIKMKPKPGTKFAKDVVRRIVNKEVSYHDLRAYINATGTRDSTASWPTLRSEKGPLFPMRIARPTV